MGEAIPPTPKRRQTDVGRANRVYSAGQMATALARGFIGRIAAVDRLLASDVDEHGRRRFTEATGAETTGDNLRVAARVRPDLSGGQAAADGRRRGRHPADDKTRSKDDH